MIEQFDLLRYIQKIYEVLEKQHKLPEPLASYQGEEWVDNPDYNLVMHLCWIARVDERQQKLWEEVRPKFKSKHQGDLRNIKEDNDCRELGYPKKLVPYSWLPKLSEYLRKENKSFRALLQDMKDMNGIETRDELKSIMGIKGKEAKRISVFIRDFLKKDVFPIDINVRKMLKSLGLPEHEEMMVHLCKNAGIDPKKLERLLYHHGKEICGKRKKCALQGLCLSSIFKLKRC